MSSNKPESSGIVHSGVEGAKSSVYGASHPCLVSLKSMSYLRSASEGELVTSINISGKLTKLAR
jgi:hypothetical protein